MGTLWTSPARLCVTEDGSRAVIETDTEAARVLVTRGGQIDLERAVALGIAYEDGSPGPRLVELGLVAAPARVDPEPAPLPEPVPSEPVTPAGGFHMPPARRRGGRSK